MAQAARPLAIILMNGTLALDVIKKHMHSVAIRTKEMR